MAKRLREHSVSEYEAGDDEHLQDVSTSGPLHRTKFCPQNDLKRCGLAQTFLLTHSEELD